MSTIKDIIKDLYYGKIRPWETAVISDSDYYNLSKLCSELINELALLLDDNSKAILNKAHICPDKSDRVFVLGKLFHRF